MSKQYLTVSQLTSTVKLALDQTVGTVFVRGEVASATRSSLGHWYFTLKDQGAQVSCVCFSRQAASIKGTITVGMQVSLCADASFYAPRGQFQLTVWSIEQGGDGLLQAAFLKLKAELHEQGLFDVTAKKALPPIPATIGVITSPTGAAVADILKVLQQRFPLAQVMIYPSLVQGDLASAQIVKAMVRAQEHAVADVLILSRGGGDLSDLMAFNDKSVALAMSACTIPIISGIGHEIDETIADYVADVRAATPSAAAAMVVPDQYELQQSLGERADRLCVTIRRALALYQSDLVIASRRLISPLESLRRIQTELLVLSGKIAQIQRDQMGATRRLLLCCSHTLALRSPLNTMQQYDRQCLRLSNELVQSIRGCLNQKTAESTAIISKLQGLSPKQILSRGYAAVLNEDGCLLSRDKSVDVGQHIQVCLSESKLLAAVLSVEANDRS